MGAKRSSARRWTPSAARLARGVARLSDRDAVDCSMVVDLLEQNDKACLHRSTTFCRRVGQQPTASPLYFGPKMGVKSPENRERKRGLLWYELPCVALPCGYSFSGCGPLPLPS